MGKKNNNKERKISCKRREKEGSVECNVPISRGEDPKTNLNSQRERERKGKKDRERESSKEGFFAMADALSVIPASVVRNLSDKLYEKRKNAALEVSFSFLCPRILTVLIGFGS